MPIYGPDGRPVENKLQWYDLCQDIITIGVWETEVKYGYSSLDNMSRALIKFGMDNPAIKSMNTYLEAIGICLKEAEDLSKGRARLMAPWEPKPRKNPETHSPEYYRQDMKDAWARERESELTRESERGLLDNK